MFAGKGDIMQYDNSYFTNLMDGLMLSDGSIVKASVNTVRYNQRCIHKEWVEDIGKTFECEGIDYSIYYKPAHKGEWTDGRKINRKDCFTIQTRGSSFFVEQRKRWYKWYELDGDGRYIKTVPKDIKLTPECVANWYMGDGNINCRKMSNSSYTITLCTDGFDEYETNYLSCLLNNYINFDISHVYNKRIVITKKEGVRMFLDYVKQYVLPCFSYKLNIGG